MMNDVLKTKWVDIRETVFDNETEAIMYITKDYHDDSYIIAIPVITFSWEIASKQDYDNLLKLNLFGIRERREKLVEEIKKAVAEF